MKRAIALLLSFLMANQAVFGTMPEQSLWEQRRQSVNKNTELFAQLPLSHGFPAFSRSENKPLPSLPAIAGGNERLAKIVSALSANGVVQDIRVSKDVRNNPVVVYLQDVHGQTPAQQSI